VFLVGPQLFSGEELAAHLEARKAEAVAALGALAPGEVAARDRGALLREIHERFAVPATSMRVESAHFTGERPLTADEREAIGVAEADAASFKAVTIAIPYAGDSHLFTCRPAIYSAHQPQAEPRDGALHVTYFLSEAEEFQLEANFKRLIALIERTLEVTQWQAMGYNQDLMDALSAALAERTGAGA